MLYVATAVFFLALALGVTSLITPRAALLCRNKTRLKGLVSWLAVALVAFGVIAYLAPKPPTPTAEAPAAPAVVAEAPAAPAQEKAETVPVSAEPVVTGHPLPVRVVENTSYERVGRLRVKLTLLPAGDQAAATQADLTATVMAAAIQAAKENRAQVVTVTLICQQAANAFGEVQLGYAVYIPDGKGVDGKSPGPVWQMLDAAPRGFTAKELEYLRLWAELRSSYQTPDGLTDDARLRAAIAKRMGIKEGSLRPQLYVRQPVQPVRVEGTLEVRK